MTRGLPPLAHCLRALPAEGPSEHRLAATASSDSAISRSDRPELLGYVDSCRGRVQHTLAILTEEVAARPLPNTHRYHGMAFGVIVGNVPGHVIEHAAQIRQLLTAAGVKVRPMPGDRGYPVGT